MPKSNITKVWAVNEIVAAADLNQVAENANPQRDYTLYSNVASGFSVSATTTFVTLYTQAHTPRTSRVKVTVNLTVANATGAVATYDYTLHHGSTAAVVNNASGSATNGFAQDSVANNQSSHITFVVIVTGLTPGVLWYFGPGSRRSVAGTACTSPRNILLIEDF